MDDPLLVVVLVQLINRGYELQLATRGIQGVGPIVGPVFAFRGVKTNTNNEHQNFTFSLSVHIFITFAQIFLLFRQYCLHLQVRLPQAPVGITISAVPSQFG